MPGRTCPHEEHAVAVGRVLGLLRPRVVSSWPARWSPAARPGGRRLSAAPTGGVDWFHALPADLPTGARRSVSRSSPPTAVVDRRISGENRAKAPLKQDQPNMQNAIIAIEDGRFRDHGGVDPVGLLRAIASNVRQRRGGAGAST